jgi:hypothetical protein
MIQPRLIIHAVRELQEHAEILRAQMKFLLRSAEVETLVRPECPFRVLASMPKAFAMWRSWPKPDRAYRPVTKPHQRLAGFCGHVGRWWKRCANRGGERLNDIEWSGAWDAERDALREEDAS